MHTTSRPKMEKPIRIALGSLLLLLSVNALGGGYYGMAGARDVPAEWLEGSPFNNYFIPGLFLFVVIGGSALLAAILVFRRHRHARQTALACGTITLLWIAIQVAIIGYVSWMQPATTVAALAILLLAWRMHA